MRWTVALVALVALPLLTGCGAIGQHETAPGTEGHEYRLPTSDVIVPQGGVSWMSGSVLHVDGREVDTGVRPEQYLLVSDGVVLQTRAGRLWFSDTRTPAREVGEISGGSYSLAVSPDGRYVAFLDSDYGPADENGERVLRLDVLDATTGRQLLASARGLGDPHGDVGISEQYEEYDPQVRAVDDHAAYALGPGSRTWAYPLDGSPPHRVPESEVPTTQHGGEPASLTRTKQGWRNDPQGSFTGSVSPTGTLGLADVGNLRFAPYDPATGSTVTFERPAASNQFALGGWLPGGDFWGVAFRSQYLEITRRAQVVTCTVAEHRCRPVSDPSTSTGRLLLPGGPP